MTPTKIHTTVLCLLLLLILHQDVTCHRLLLFPLRKRPSGLGTSNTHRLQLPLRADAVIAEQGGDPEENDGPEIGILCSDSSVDDDCSQRSSLKRTLIDLLFRVKETKQREPETEEQDDVTSRRLVANKRQEHRGTSSFYSNW